MQIIIQAVVLRSMDGEFSLYSFYTALYGRLQVRDMRFAKKWDTLVVGDVGHATLLKRGRQWLLSSFESVMTRSQHTEADFFYWRSHFLDMYFYYIPLEQPCADLFGLLVFVLQISSAPLVLFKLCAVRFFVLLGYAIPESLRWYTQALHPIMNEQEAKDVLRFEIKEEYILGSKELDMWLVETVTKHDHFRYLKTHMFLPQLYCMQGDTL